MVYLNNNLFKEINIILNMPRRGVYFTTPYSSVVEQTTVVF